MQRSSAGPDSSAELENRLMRAEERIMALERRLDAQAAASEPPEQNPEEIYDALEVKNRSLAEPIEPGLPRVATMALSEGRKTQRSRSFDSRAVQNEDVVELEGSTWGALMLATVSSGEIDNELPMSLMEKAVVFLLHVLNLTMQTVFICGIITTMSGNPYDGPAISTMTYQRLFSGHAYENIDRATLQSRVSKLCGDGWHNRLASTSADTFTYLQLGGGGVPGSVICLVALTIWILSMGQEIRRTADQCAAVLLLPRPEGSKSSDRTQHGKLGNDDDGYSVLTMTIRKKIILLVVLFIPRMALGLTLLWFGLLFIADTPVVSDLILNACALEIVQQIDEQLFEAICSRRLQHAVTSTRISCTSTSTVLHRWFGPETKDDKIRSRLLMCGRMLTLSSVLLLGWYLRLNPLVASVEEAYKGVCGGTQDFAYINHPTGGLPVFAQVSADDASQMTMCFYAAQYELLALRAGFEPTHFPMNHTLAQLVNGTHKRCKASQNACPNTNLRELGMLDALGTQYYDSPQCADQQVLFAVLRETCLSDDFKQNNSGLNQFQNRWTCADVADLCLREDGKRRSPDEHKNGTGHLGTDWVQMLEGICPKTCLRCRNESTTLDEFKLEG